MRPCLAMKSARSGATGASPHFSQTTRWKVRCPAMVPDILPDILSDIVSDIVFVTVFVMAHSMMRDAAVAAAVFSGVAEPYEAASPLCCAGSKRGIGTLSQGASGHGLMTRR